MRERLVFCLILICTIATAEESLVEGQLTENDFRNCEDVLVDDVTDMAFGDQGQPFTGKVRCFYDTKMKFIKSERVFDEGTPVGSHHCFFWNGIIKYTIIYKNGKRYKLGSEFFSPQEEIDPEYSFKKKNGKGYKLGSIYIIPGEYRELPCLYGTSPTNRCLKGVWSNCF